MLWKIIIILCVNMLLYARALRCGYVSDDIPALQRRKEKKMLPFERIWQSAVSGKPMLDHGISMAVHAFCCVFIYTGLGANNISFFAALLFSANPINNQGSIWISGRNYAWCGLLMMLSMTCTFSAPFAMIGAVVSSAAYFVPIGFIGSGKWYLVLFLPIVWAVYYTRLRNEVKSRRGHEAVAFDKKFGWEKIVIAIKIYGWYFGLCIIPFQLTWYHSFMQSGAGAGNELEKKKALRLDWTFWLGLSLIGYLIYSAIWNWTPVAWGIFWYSCSIAPYLNIFRMSQEIAERYCYIANIGIMFALANLLNPIAFAFILGGYVMRLMVHIPAYTDDYWLIERSVAEDPGAWYAWHVRALKRWQQQAIREALNCWVMAKMISPQEFKILFNIAVVLKILKQDKEAEEYLKLAQQNVIKGQEKISDELIVQFRKGQCPMLH